MRRLATWLRGVSAGMADGAHALLVLRRLAALWRSRTMLASALLAVLGRAQVEAAVLTRSLSPSEIGWLLIGLAALFAALRLVTRLPVWGARDG